MIDNNILQPHYLREEKAEPLDEILTKDLKWGCLGAACPSSCCCNFAYSRISLHEIMPLSKYFPIVFYAVDRGYEEQELAVCILMRMVKDNTSCTYLQKGVGCMLREERPLTCKQYPFSIAEDQPGSNKILVRLTCPGFSEKPGRPIITPDNRISPYLKQEYINPALSKYAALEETKRFVETISRYNLIAPGQYNYRGESILFNIIDAKRLYGLPPEVLDDFRTNGYLKLLNAHMDSLISNCTKLIDVYLERTASSDLPHITAPLLKPDAEAA